MESSTNHVARQPRKNTRTTKAQLQEQLAEATARARRAEAGQCAAEQRADQAEADAADVRQQLATAITDAQAVAAAAAAAPPEIMPTQDGVAFIFFTVRDTAYKITFGGQN